MNPATPLFFLGSSPSQAMQGRKPKWNSPTKAIRIPAKYADRLIEMAREWEQAEEKEEDAGQGEL